MMQSLGDRPSSYGVRTASTTTIASSMTKTYSQYQPEQGQRINGKTKHWKNANVPIKATGQPPATELNVARQLCKNR